MNEDNVELTYVVRDDLTGLFLTDSRAERCTGEALSDAYVYESKYQAMSASRSNESAIEVKRVTTTTLTQL
jgi:hypothetical protein